MSFIRILRGVHPPPLGGMYNIVTEYNDLLIFEQMTMSVCWTMVDVVKDATMWLVHISVTAMQDSLSTLMAKYVMVSIYFITIYT